MFRNFKMEIIRDRCQTRLAPHQTKTKNFFLKLQWTCMQSLNVGLHMMIKFFSKAPDAFMFLLPVSTVSAWNAWNSNLPIWRNSIKEKPSAFLDSSFLWKPMKKRKNKSYQILLQHQSLLNCSPRC